MGISSSLPNFKIESQRYQKIINKFVSSSRFTQLVIDLKMLDDIYSKHCSYEKECDIELAKINSYLDRIHPIKAAFIRENFDNLEYLDIDEALTSEELSIRDSLSSYEIKLMNELNTLMHDDYNNQLNYERDMKCQRYIIQETMSFLLSDLYPINKT